MSETLPRQDVVDRDIERELVRLDRLADTLDSRFRIPGTPIRFGLDTLVGLVPGIGDTLVAAPSAWMIWRGHKMGVRRHRLAQMAANTGIDYVIGSIPLVGDIFDLGFKANLRNMAILRKELTGRTAAARAREAA
ncbi:MULTISPECIES: DUF4112 domain-containing protein [unclassified Roseitalea]|uniref:DUF4112 domain-containing protein n=1 Tax=unclassified Roseitalea TaxID=2639107 RepID=UPI00274027B5|nr:MULTISPECIES: DUF4112 domain-containing protein [unclassified Roseitalea]